MLNASGAFSAAAATNTAARPTNEWNAATSCGNAVIWMRSATTTPIAAADQDAEHDQQVATAAHAVMQQRGDHGDGHADHAETVALPRRDRGGQAAQRQDEQDGGDQISEGGQAGGHRCGLIAFS